MESYKQQFIELMLKAGVLTFGDFTTKSGRKTPFFINTGNYRTGSQLAQLGEYYAQAINANFANEYNVLFGPAYKGIPLVVSTSIALATSLKKDVPFCFNRKEAKDHGEGGVLIGQKLNDGDKIIIIEDVITAGTSIRESIPILKAAAKVDVVGLIVSVNRMEKGTTAKSALQEVHDEFGIKSCAIVNLDEIVSYLYNKTVLGKVWIDDSMKKRIDDYRKLYGVQ